MKQIDDLLFYFIEQLAFHYNWSKQQILDITLLEALEYTRAIQKNKLIDNITQLAIVSNPHTKKPKELANQFNRELRKLENRGIIEDVRDKDATEKLKQIFNKGKK